MAIFLTNTLTRKKEEFLPIKKGKAGMYTCGLTVYDRGHIGNFRAFLIADVLRRVFEMNGYTVNHITNITDVGHLVGDGSVGEDKLALAGEKQGKTAWEIADAYIAFYLADMKKLNILPPHKMPRATDHIPEQIEMIKALEKNGHTYQISDGVYFDVTTLPDYGRLSRQKLEDKEAGARVDVGEKHHPADFALWKFSPVNEQRHMEWDSPWGKGFPGWHIECSAMSEKYLGVPFDIHTGGADHIAVHHENEIAQVEGARGVLEANYWIHNEFLMVDNGKMSKSLKNFFTIDDLEKKNISPLAFRYFILGAHYRAPQNFTWEAVYGAQQALNNLVDTVREWSKPKTVDEKAKAKFLEAVNDDLDTANALAILWSVVKDEEMDTGVKAATVLFFDEVLGLALKDVVAKPLVIPAIIQRLLAERDVARINKDWAQSDAIRDEVAEKGYLIEDTKDGQHIREKR